MSAADVHCQRTSAARTKDLVGKVGKGERHDGVPCVAHGDDGEDAVDPHAVAAQQAVRQRQRVHMARHQHPREVVPAAAGELDVHLQAVEDQHQQAERHVVPRPRPQAPLLDLGACAASVLPYPRPTPVSAPTVATAPPPRPRQTHRRRRAGPGPRTEQVRRCSIQWPPARAYAEIWATAATHSRPSTSAARGPCGPPGRGHGRTGTKSWRPCPGGGGSAPSGGTPGA